MRYNNIMSTVYYSEPIEDRRLDKIYLCTREISSIELAIMRNEDCRLKVCMSSGKMYEKIGNCQELEGVRQSIVKEVVYKFPGIYLFQE